MKRLLTDRRISKFKRLGDSERYLADIYQKPVLTQRDKEVLLSIYFHRCLTTEQIAEMHFRYDSAGKENSQATIIARRRLRKLFDYQLIDRFFIEVGEGCGSSQAHMILDSLGAKVVAGLLNMKMEDVSWRYDMNEARLPYLGHMVSVNDFYLYTLRKARQRRGEACGFRVENHIRHEFTHWGEKRVFNPDGYGQYWEGEEGFHYFLEWDNDTMTPGTFQRKHQRYAAYYDSGEYRKAYENFPIILTVAPTMDRAEALRKVIRDTDETDMEWLFTSEERAKEDILGKVWVDKKGNAVSLLG